MRESDRPTCTFDVYLRDAGVGLSQLAICLAAASKTSILSDTKSTICLTAIPRYIWHINHILLEKQTTMLAKTTFVLHNKVSYRTQKYVSFTHVYVLYIFTLSKSSIYYCLLSIVQCVYIFTTHVKKKIDCIKFVILIESRLFCLIKINKKHEYLTQRLHKLIIGVFKTVSVQ